MPDANVEGFVSCLAEPKSKRFRLDTFSGIKTSPIKATYEFRCNEQVHKYRYRPKTSILVRPYWDTQFVGRNSKQIHEIPLWRGLLDSGSDGDLLFVRRGSNSTATLPYLNRAITQVWHTGGGILRTERQAQIEVTFPEFSHGKRVKLEPDIVYYDDNSPEPKLDLIIGNATMDRLGVILDFKSHLVTVDEIKLPMRNLKNLQTKDARFEIYYGAFFTAEPDATDEATKRTVKILDAKYEPADLPKLVEEECQHLTSAEKQDLLKLLTEFKQLFDGTLGDWDTPPVHLELKEGAKPYHGRAFPVPFIHKDTLRKEVERLKKLGVLKWEGASEWASPI